MSDVIADPPPDLTIGATPESAWERERRAFALLLPALRATHEGRYVAIQDGKIVASGADKVAVAQDAYARVGYVPVYVGHVTESHPQPIRLPSPRLWRHGARP